MKIIVTGGSGFIGTNLIEYLCSNMKANVLNIDIQPPKVKIYEDLWIKTDIRDRTKLFDVVSSFNPDYVIHLAARTDLEGQSIKDYDSNTLGVENLIEACNKTSSVKRILFTSSMLVCKAGYNPISEQDYCPTTVYGESKVITEEIIRKATINAQWCIIRPTSIWGPWFGEPYRNFFDIVLNGLFVHPGNKACTKTYGYVGNSVLQIRSLLESVKSEVNKKVFYIGDSPAINISEWADEIAAASTRKRNMKIPFVVFKFLALCGDLFKLIEVKFPLTSFRLKNMTTDNIINLDATNKLSNIPAITRESGIVQTLEWLKKH